mgnify:CR=1 FL=1|jgi:hypothetical protein
MFKKFDSVWTKLEVSDKTIETACVEKLRRMAWMIYITSKDMISETSHGSSLTELAFLIVAVLHFLVENTNHSSSKHGPAEI